jgi:hypothetical protein
MVPAFVRSTWMFVNRKLKYCIQHPKHNKKSRRQGHGTQAHGLELTAQLVQCWPNYYNGLHVARVSSHTHYTTRTYESRTAQHACRHSTQKHFIGESESSVTLAGAGAGAGAAAPPNKIYPKCSRAPQVRTSHYKTIAPLSPVPWRVLATCLCSATV